MCGCNVLPPFPEVVQFGVYANLPEPGFYGVDNMSHARFYKKFDDPSMKGAQCLDVRAYKASERWIASVKLIAETRCVCH